MSLLSSLQSAVFPRRSLPSPSPAASSEDHAISHSRTETWDARVVLGQRSADTPLYDFGLAMLAPAYFPWLRVGVVKAAANLAGLPLITENGDVFTGANTRDRLMWWVSLLLCDECWAETPAGVELSRYIHPVIGWVDNGEAVGVRRNGREIAEPVEWYRGFTFSARENNRGTSAVMSLQAVLNTEFNVDRHAAGAARRGRVSMLLTPRTDDGAFGPAVRDALRADEEAQRAAGFDTLYIPRNVAVTPVDLSPRDMEFGEVVNRAQAAALAVMSVPPSMAGLPSAAYGTATAELTAFWEYYRNVAGNDDPSSGMNGFLSRVYGVKLRHDFRGVRYLRDGYAGMAETAAKLIQGAGVKPSDAMAIAGFSKADSAKGGAIEVTPKQGQPEKTSDTPRERIARALRDSAERWAIGDTDQATEAACLSGALRACGVPAADADARSGSAAASHAISVRIAKGRGADVRTLAAFSDVRSLLPE